MSAEQLVLWCKTIVVDVVAAGAEQDKEKFPGAVWAKLHNVLQWMKQQVIAKDYT